MVLAAPTAAAYRVRTVLGLVVAQSPLAGGTAMLGLTDLPIGLYIAEFEIVCQLGSASPRKTLKPLR